MEELSAVLLAIELVVGYHALSLLVSWVVSSSISLRPFALRAESLLPVIHRWGLGLAQGEESITEVEHLALQTETKTSPEHFGLIFPGILHL